MPCLSNSILFFCVCFFILIVFFKIILMTYLLNSLQWNPFWDPWMPFLLALFHFCLVALQSMSNLNDYNIFLCFFFATSIFLVHPFINSTRCCLLFIFSLHNCMNPYNDIFSSYIMCNWWFILLFIYQYVFSFASH